MAKRDYLESVKTKAFIMGLVVAPEGDADAQRLALCDRIRRHELFAVVEIQPEALDPAAKKDEEKAQPRVGFYTNAGGIDETRSWLRDPVNRGLREVHLARHG